MLSAARVIAVFLCFNAPAEANDLARLFGRHDTLSTTVVDHADFGRLIGRFVAVGEDGVNRVDYRRFKEEGQGALRDYLSTLQKVEVAGLARAEQAAFWLNLYNALTIDVVLSHYPVESIRSIAISPGLFSRGPWGKKLVTIEQTPLSLDDIEHAIARPIWRDPRLHYGFNCASIGCPNLPMQPFSGQRLDAMLDRGAREYVNHPRGVSVTEKGVVLSSIYKWYAEDFGKGEAALFTHIRRFAEPKLAERLKGVKRVADYHYDWRLNDVAVK